MKKKKKSSFKMIPCVDASDMPDDVLEWCEMNDISTHYRSSVAMCWDRNEDNRVFIDWIESLGIKPEWYQIGKEKRGHWTVAIIAT